MAAEKSVHILVKGRVQGVGYRSWLQRKAFSLELSGWVRNRRSGEVEAVFRGPDVIVDEMVGACRSGPRWARVTDIEIVPNIPPVPTGFHVKETE